MSLAVVCVSNFDISFNMFVGFNPLGQSLTAGLLCKTLSAAALPAKHPGVQNQSPSFHLSFTLTLPFQLVFGVFVSFSESSGQKEEPLRPQQPPADRPHLPACGDVWTRAGGLWVRQIRAR